MQFLKTLQPTSKGQGDNSISDGTEKFNLNKYTKNLFFIPYLHDSKMGLVNSLAQLNNSNSGAHGLASEINTLRSKDNISDNLQTLFNGINDYKFKLTQSDKEEIEELLKGNSISQQLRDTCLAVYEPQELIPDIVASQIKMLFENGQLNSRMIRECLKCCRDLIYNMGYKQLFTANHIRLEHDELDTIVNRSSEIKNVLIIPGCQEEGMLSGRILRAVQLLRYFKGNLTIIASGGNPLANTKNPPDKISSENEAKTIMELFNEFIGKLNVKTSEDWIYKVEDKSPDSIANVKKSIASGDYMKPNEQHNLIVVSSSFHLIKLSRVIEEEVKKITATNPNFVHNIILFGSEQVEDDFSPEKRGGYIKSMFVEVYKELLTIHKNSNNGVAK